MAILQLYPLSTLLFLSPLPILLVLHDPLLQEAPLNHSCPGHPVSSQTQLLPWPGTIVVLLEWADIPCLWMSPAHAGWQLFPGWQRKNSSWASSELATVLKIYQVLSNI